MHDKSNDPSWLFTPEGHSRGYIESDALRELWFHTGTNCNGWIPSGSPGTGTRADPNEVGRAAEPFRRGMCRRRLPYDGY